VEAIRSEDSTAAPLAGVVAIAAVVVITAGAAVTTAAADITAVDTTVGAAITGVVVIGAAAIGATQDTDMATDGGWVLALAGDLIGLLIRTIITRTIIPTPPLMGLTIHTEVTATAVTMALIQVLNRATEMNQLKIQAHPRPTSIPMTLTLVRPFRLR